MSPSPKAIEVADYYDQDQSDILDLLDDTPASALEVGCATGKMLATLQGSGVQRLVGVEYVDVIADQARKRCPDAHIFAGSIDDITDEQLGGNFDLIIASMVLEHLIDPWATISRLKGLLREGGQIIGTLPNIRHFSITKDLLLRGRWDYQDFGILDRTHYRFFTKYSIEQLLTGAGFNKIVISPRFGKNSSTLNNITLGLMQDHLAFYYAFSAKR